MPKELKGIILGVVTLFFTGCMSHWTDDQINFHPEVKIDSSTIGSGKSIRLTVLDDRLDTILGYQYNDFDIYNPNAKGAPIRTKVDIEAELKKSIENGLKKIGFTIGSESQSNELRVELRHVNSSAVSQGFTGTVYTEAAIKAFCFISDDIEYEQFYRGNDTIEKFLTPSEEENAKFINDTVSKTLKKIFDDRMLLKCLSS